ncbi:MAG: hypothetical protein GC134_08325 [Proteobacteria bacterium]|nr:hypothetical protein [Pseudomonadota bacterium]
MQKADRTIRRHKKYDCSIVANIMDSFSDASTIEVAVRHLHQKYRVPLQDAFIMVTEQFEQTAIRWARVLANDVADISYNHRGLSHITISKTIRYAVLADNSSLTIQQDPETGKWLAIQAQMPVGMIGMTYLHGGKLQDALDTLAINNNLAVRSQAEAFLIAAERTRLSPIAAAMFFFKIDHFPSADYVIGDRHGGGRALAEVKMPDGTSISFEDESSPQVNGVSEKYLRLDGQLVSRHTLERRVERVMQDPNVQMIFGSVLRIMADQRKRREAAVATATEHQHEDEFVEKAEALAV